LNRRPNNDPDKEHDFGSFTHQGPQAYLEAKAGYLVAARTTASFERL